MKFAWRKFSRGSILAYSLILLGIVLVAAIGMMSASVTNLKSVSSNDNSVNAFQIADSGSQDVIAKIRKASGSTVGDIDTSGNMTCGSSSAVLSSGSSTGFLGGAYSVTFLKIDGTALKCSDNISDIASIKSVGSYAETARAVETAVAATTSGGGINCTTTLYDFYHSGSPVMTFICCKDNGNRPSCLGYVPAYDGTGVNSDRGWKKLPENGSGDTW